MVKSPNNKKEIGNFRYMKIEFEDFISRTEADTADFAKKIAAMVSPGTVIALYGNFTGNSMYFTITYFHSNRFACTIGRMVR